MNQNRALSPRKGLKWKKKEMGSHHTCQGTQLLLHCDTTHLGLCGLELAWLFVGDIKIQ